MKVKNYFEKKRGLLRIKRRRGKLPVKKKFTVFTEPKLFSLLLTEARSLFLV